MSASKGRVPRAAPIATPGRTAPGAGDAAGAAPNAAETLLAFWFGSEPLRGEALAARMRTWFQASPDFDAALRERFAPLAAEAAAGHLDAWAASPRGRLALILLLDQLPRNLFRGEPRAFATDAQALAWTQSGIDSGLDRALASIERSFFYLPLEHAEDPAAQARSVAVFTALAHEATPELRSVLTETLAYAVQHRDLIARFGRFPHRNHVLGRASTPDEERHLREGGARFGQ